MRTKQSNVTPLVMPKNYAVLSEEEMMYVEGGATKYTATQCYYKMLEAARFAETYANNMSGSSTTGGYAAYGAVIYMYQYQANQYGKGYNAGKGKGVIYYGPLNIKVL